MDTLSALGALNYPLGQENEQNQQIHKHKVLDSLTAVSKQW